MSRLTIIRRKLYYESDGVTIVFVAFLMVVFLAFAAMGIDIAHLYVVKNELQNAADAGALAGARCLYDCMPGVIPGSVVNVNANQIAYQAATANRSENVAVEVNWESGNEGDVQRGHWSFATRTFTPNSSTDPPQLWDKTTEELDADTNFINAVRVRTRRQAIPADSFFARILGFAGFGVSAESIAYIGFAGTLLPHSVDLPIAICKQSLLLSGKYTCSVGRMINSSTSTETGQTGGWTDFNQEGDPCKGGANANVVKDLTPSNCSFPGNPKMLVLGRSVGTQGGEIQNAFDRIYDCWVSTTNRTQSWKMTLPVIDCTSSNVGPCEKVTGAVTVEIIWINRTLQGGQNLYDSAPTTMVTEDISWSSSDPNGEARWNSFVSVFNLKNMDGSTATWEQKTIYFRPSCTPHESIGITGGQNFGILAKIPVLVN